MESLSHLNDATLTLVSEITNKQIEKEFLAMKDNFQKIVFVEKLLEKNGFLPKFQNLVQLKSQKDNKKSEEFRVLGNECFKQENYKEALIYYNQSLCFATADSPSLGIAFANRSAVYFKIGSHEKCLENIELARNNNYPASLMEKLKKREEDCLEIINNVPPKASKDQKLIDNLLKPKLPRNKRYDHYVADCLEVKRSPEFGRHVITNEDLKVGTVITIEKPFSSVLSFELKYQKCENCLSENVFSLLPCKSCPSVMFCSEECRDVAYRKFHKFECGLHGSGLFKFSCHVSYAKRLFYEALDICGTPTKLKDFCDSIKNSDKHILEFNCGSADKNTKRKNALHSILSLVTYNKLGILDFAEDFGRCIISITSNNMMLNCSETLRDTLPTEADRILFKALVYQFAQTLAINSFGMFSVIDINYYNFLKYGTAIFPFLSLFNHSCAPNTMSVCETDKMYLTVFRPIKKGSEVFLSYTATHFHEDIETRQFETLRSYAFKCRCEGCENNYKMCSSDTPPYSDPHFLKKFPLAELELLINIRNADSTWEYYYRACKYMQKYGLKNYSVYIREMYVLNISMQHCLTVALDCQEKLIWK